MEINITKYGMMLEYDYTDMHLSEIYNKELDLNLLHQFALGEKKGK